MGVAPLTNAQLYADHRIKVKIPIASSNNVEVKSARVEVENQSLKPVFADPDGTARPRCGSTS